MLLFRDDFVLFELGSFNSLRLDMFHRKGENSTDY